MSNHSALAVANEFLKLSPSSLPQMKLQKLVYMAHGWNLAINEEPLISDRIEAWDNGPVVRQIWNHIRDYGHNYNKKYFSEYYTGEKHTANFTTSEQDIIKHVWKKYSKFNSYQLSDMTHKPGTPWTNTYFGMGRNSAINDQDIKKHFVELALAGRAA